MGIDLSGIHCTFANHHEHQGREVWVNWVKRSLRVLTVLTIFSHSWSGLVEGVMSLSPMDTTRVCGQYNSNLFWKGELLINLPYLCLSKKLWTCLPPMPNTANHRWKKSGTRELSSQKKFWFWTFRRKKFGVKKKLKES